jgi:hypothetical protein
MITTYQDKPDWFIEGWFEPTNEIELKDWSRFVKNMNQKEQRRL